MQGRAAGMPLRTCESVQPSPGANPQSGICVARSAAPGGGGLAKNASPGRRRLPGQGLGRRVMCLCVPLAPCVVARTKMLVASGLPAARGANRVGREQTCAPQTLSAARGSQPRAPRAGSQWPIVWKKHPFFYPKHSVFMNLALGWGGCGQSVGNRRRPRPPLGQSF